VGQGSVVEWARARSSFRFAFATAGRKPRPLLPSIGRAQTAVKPGSSGKQKVACRHETRLSLLEPVLASAPARLSRARASLRGEGRQADRASGLMGVAGLPGQIPCGVTRVSTPVAGNMAGNLRFDPRRRFPDPRPARSPGLYQVVLLTIRARLLLVPTRSQRIDDKAGREGERFRRFQSRTARTF